MSAWVSAKQLEAASYPVMDRLAASAGLEEDKDDSAGNGDEVEREVQEVAHYGLGAELVKRTAQDLAQPSDGVTA